MINSFVDLVVSWCSVIYAFIAGLFCGKTIRFDSGRKVSVGAVLGEGAFSFVYKGHSCQSGEVYAIKKMYMQSEELHKSVENEIAALKRFQHENIIRMIDFVFQQESGRGRVAFLLFPFTPKGSLRDVLNVQLSSGGGPPRGRLGRALKGFRDICKAINLMHTYSPPYVHRDIKPENILFSDQGMPLLIDFGSACPADIAIATRSDSIRVADDGSQFCSVAYRAPELFDPPVGRRLDTRTDVWSLGCLLFAWYYGYSPYESEFMDNGALRVVECSHLRVLSKPPRNPRSGPEDVAIMSIVDWILESDFQNRPFTIDVIRKIDGILSAQSGGKNYGDSAV
jgi:serine/threonine kinase 16